MSSRMSLRDFQQDLARRLAQAEEDKEQQTALLAVSTGRDNWLVALPDVGEIFPVVDLVSVPLTQPWFRGLINVRGNLFSVVDLAVFSGASVEPLTGDCRVMLVGVKHSLNTAVLASKTHGLRNPDDFEPDQTFTDSRPWVDGAVRDSQGKLWKRLVPRSLLTDTRFLDAQMDHYRRGLKS